MAKGAKALRWDGKKSVVTEACPVNSTISGNPGDMVKGIYKWYFHWAFQGGLYATKATLLTGTSIPTIDLYMDVSENSGTPKSSILIGFSIINHPFWGTPIFGNTYMWNHLNRGETPCCSTTRNAVTLASAVNACDKGAQWAKGLELLQEVSGRTQGEEVGSWKVRPVMAGSLSYQLCPGHGTRFSNAGWKSQGFPFPKKNGALCLGIYDDPSRILRQNLSKMGGFDFFKKNFQRALRICFFWEGRRKAVGGESFFLRDGPILQVMQSRWY